MLKTKLQNTKVQKDHEEVKNKVNVALKNDLRKIYNTMGTIPKLI